MYPWRWDRVAVMLFYMFNERERMQLIYAAVGCWEMKNQIGYGAQ